MVHDPHDIAIGDIVANRYRVDAPLGRGGYGAVFRVVDTQSGQIDELREMIPICANCKSIRDDEGFWNRIETYIESRSETVLTHGLCDTCAEEFLTEARLLNQAQSPPELPPESPSRGY